MRILYLREDGWSGPLLCVTHSQRAVDLARCSREFLVERYSRPDRLPPATPFESLRPSIDHSPFKGDVTVWRLDDPRRPALLAHLRPEAYKPQHAIWSGGRLWVLGVESLEIFDPSMHKVGQVTDPWLAGGHTIWPDGCGGMLVTCSASDAVLTIDIATLHVTHAWRLPGECYGHNYALSRDMSVVDHFIDNDRQLTHVNAAVPWRDGMLVSTLIQGAIGYRPRLCPRILPNPDAPYVELTRGHVGCHGVRTDAAGRITFCDSCAGTLLRLGPDGRTRVLIDVQSRWLHDAQEVKPGLFALAVADKNTVDLIDLATGNPIGVIDGSGYGESTQFLWYGQ